MIPIGDTPRFFSEFYPPRVEYKSWNINTSSKGGILSQYRASR